MTLCKESCENLPDRFEENLERLFTVMYNPDGEVNDVIARMVAELDRALLKVRPGEFTAGQPPMGAAEKQ